MHALAQFISLPSLDSAIEFFPLSVAPDTPLLDVIALMRKRQPQARCVLIAENLQILGWFTEHDASQLLFSDVNLQTAKVSEVMETSVLTLKRSNVYSVVSVLSFLRQYHLCSVPLVDEQDQLIGLITYESICQALEQQAGDLTKTEVQRGLLEVAVANANDAIAIIETHELHDFFGWHIVYVNEALTRMSGWSACEIIGKDISILYDEKTSGSEIERIRAALGNGSSIRTEFINDHKDGSTYWVEVNISPIAYSEGKITHFVCIQRDITERKLAEEALRSSEELFRQLAENIHQVLFVRDLKQNKIIYINQAYEEIWGRSRDRLYEESFDFLEAIHPLDRDGFAGPTPQSSKGGLGRDTGDCPRGSGKANRTIATRSTFENGHLYSQEYRIVRPDGEERWIWTRAIPLKSELGEVYRLFGVSEDITERKRATEALRESEERFRKLADEVPVLIWMDDANGLCTFLNQYCWEFTGRPFEELLGEGWTQRIHPEDKQHCLEIYLSAFKNHQRFQYEFRYLRADGEYRWLINIGVPRFASNGSFIGYIGCCIDITERVQAEASLQQVQAELKQTNAELERRFEERTRAVKEMNRQLIFEMTDRLYAEEQLRQSQQMLQLIMDNIPQSIFWKDKACVYLGCNRIFAKMVGLESPENVVGKTDYDLAVHKQEADFYHESDLRVMQTDTPEYRLIVPHLQKDGKQVWLEISKIPLHDHEGNVMGVLGTFEDITERKLAEELLVRFRKAIESTCDAIGMTDSTGEVIYLNPAFVELFEYSLEELRYSGGLSAIYTSMVEHERVFAIVNRGDSWRGETTMKSLSGRILQVELRGNAIKDATGKIIGSLGIYTDITERKQAEESLQLRDRAIAASSNGIMIADVTMPDSPIIYANPALEQITGYSVAEVIGKNWRFLHGSDINQLGMTELHHAMTQGKSCNVVLRNYRKDGTLFWNEISISPVYDNNGLFTHYIGIQTDITERKQAEVALLVSQERLQYLLSSSPGVIYSRKIYGDLSITFISANVIAMLGYEAQEFIENLSFWESHVHPEDRQQTFVAVSKLIDQGQNSHEYRFLHKDGTYRWMYDQAKLVHDDAGNPLEVVGYWLDITERKQLEEEIKAALHKEKELNELKSRFVSMTSHEFRTPLSTILSSSELLEHYRHRWTEEKQLSHLRRIQSAVKHMTEMLNDILTIGKAEAGKLDFIPALFDLVEYCHYLVEELQLNVNNQHPINFSSQYDSMPCCMDEKLLGHILSNLLSNAIKYSPTGSTVRFTLALQERLAVFTIQDQGIGIPPEDLPHLFESFHRATNVGTIQGTGLGLAIVKKCVETHSGEITVKSEVGVGTIFTVTLPLNNHV
ncbi:MAG: PAS domain S-box protein [Iphinoe sp. HA4291-MV1]|jgi:PAS domain S-box-containing protein|nr:PAS domain S-box protein [Iphinoe sp. HA4291-MV1]